MLRRIDQFDAGRRLAAGRRAFVADVVPGQPKTRLAIVRLLRRHAVEPDIAAGQPRHAGLARSSCRSLCRAPPAGRCRSPGSRSPGRISRPRCRSPARRRGGRSESRRDRRRRRPAQSVLPGFQPSSAAHRAMRCASSALATAISNAMPSTLDEAPDLPTPRPSPSPRRSGSPAAAGRGSRAGSCPRTRCGTGRGAAARARRD